MHERKTLMAELSDDFVALPGGLGTLEEFVEVLTWLQLGLQHKPCGLLNVADFYRPLLAFFDHATTEGFVRAEHRGLLLADTDAARLLDAFDTWTPPAVVDKWLDRTSLRDPGVLVTDSRWSHHGGVWRSQFCAWCADQHLEPLAVQRVQVERSPPIHTLHRVPMRSRSPGSTAPA
jgi:hypothetical protein